MGMCFVRAFHECIRWVCALWVHAGIGRRQGPPQQGQALQNIRLHGSKLAGKPAQVRILTAGLDSACAPRGDKRVCTAQDLWWDGWAYERWAAHDHAHAPVAWVRSVRLHTLPHRLRWMTDLALMRWMIDLIALM